MLGIALFILSAGKVGISWNPENIVYYVITIIGGVLIQGAVFLILALIFVIRSFYGMRIPSQK